MPDWQREQWGNCLKIRLKIYGKRGPRKSLRRAYWDCLRAHQKHILALMCIYAIDYARWYNIIVVWCLPFFLFLLLRSPLLLPTYKWEFCFLRCDDYYYYCASNARLLICRHGKAQKPSAVFNSIQIVYVFSALYRGCVFWEVEIGWLICVLFAIWVSDIFFVTIITKTCD